MPARLEVLLLTSQRQDLPMNEDKVAIVTGGGRGIGLSIVERLLADGYRVLSCGRSQRSEDFPEEALWIQADVSKVEDASRILAQAESSLGPVILLVNSAGVQVEKSVVDSSDDDWDLVIGVNCRGVFKLCH